MKKLIIMALVLLGLTACSKQKEDVTPRYRILISSDIGGTDPDDNQSMLHLLMYSNEFDIEGIVSSPSYGKGSKEEILRMIDKYEQDYPKLQAGLEKAQEAGEIASHHPLMLPDSLRAIAKQGKRDEASIKGYDSPTEGSDWIIKCAHKQDSRPLYILVWGCLEDVAQALHDDPSIALKIRIYWIGGPNKKWGANGYNYVVENFPDLWFIENNSSYRGFLGSPKDSSEFQAPFWEKYMKGHGVIGDDFVNYYNGIAKMGDTPSLLYMLPGFDQNSAFDPADPTKEHLGGQFETMTVSPKYIITGPLAETDTVPTYSLMEWQISGPSVDIPYDSVAFTMTVANQTWRGHYMGDGKYVVRYAPKQPDVLHYVIESKIPGFPVHEGTFVVGTEWPAVNTYHTTSPTIKATPINVGKTWWTDVNDKNLQGGVADYEELNHDKTKWPGAETVYKWRNAVMKDWAKRFSWLVL